jgi:hypothetical protein
MPRRGAGQVGTPPVPWRRVRGSSQPPGGTRSPDPGPPSMPGFRHARPAPEPRPYAGSGIAPWITSEVQLAASSRVSADR